MVAQVVSACSGHPVEYPEFKKLMEDSVLNLANNVAVCAGLSGSVSSLKQCNSDLYRRFYESLTGLQISYGKESEEDQKCQLIINSLERHLSPLLHVNLDHIRGSDIALNDQVAIKNLLDVFFILLSATSKPASHSKSNIDASTSAVPNAVPTLHDVLCTPKRSNRDEQCIHAPLLHSTPHARTRSRLPPSPATNYVSKRAESDCRSDSPVSFDSVLTALYRGYLKDVQFYSADIGQKTPLITLPTKYAKSEVLYELQNTKKHPSENILQQTEEALPFIYTAPSTLKLLRRREGCHETERKLPPSHMTRTVLDVGRKQQAMLHLLEKDLNHAKVLQENRQRKFQERCVRMAIHSKRSASARAFKYFQNYELQLKSKLQRARTREEQIFIGTFKRGLKMQQQHRRETRKYTKEQKILLEQQVCEQLEAMETFYRDQFAMLGHLLKQEKWMVQNAETVHKQVLSSIKDEFCDKIEMEIKQLQQAIDREEDICHFRNLDARNRY